ncbi:MAG: PAS domain S-box protein, partial [Smithella sp.]
MKQINTALEGNGWDADAIFENLPEITFVTNADHQIILCNKAMASRLGMSFEEIKGKHINKIFFNDQHPFADPFEEGSREEYIAKLHAAFLIKNNDVPGTALTIHTMTDSTRQKNEALYSEQEASYRTLTEMVPISVYVVQDGLFRRVNLWFTKITGYSEDYIIGRPCLSIVHPEDIEMVRRKAIEMLRGDSVTPYEYR